MKSTRGEALTIVILVLALLGGGAWFAFKPKAADGDSRRAAKSQATSETLIATQDKKGATASSYNVKSGEVIAGLAESPQKSFLEQANQIMAANLPPPDPNALIQAERLKNAVLTGQLDEARKLYNAALSDAAKLQKDLTKAISAKRASDDSLQQEAALRLGEERTKNRFIILAIAAAALYLYTKITHVSPGALATVVNDIKNDKVDAITALDGVTSRLQQTMVSWIAHLKNK